jgi:hypothetical protein
MIDLVHWSFVLALLPLLLQVCVRILRLAYWSFRAAPWPRISRICVRAFSAARQRVPSA